MEERTGTVTFKGSPMTLEGPELKEGAIAPDVTLTGQNMALISPLSHSEGKKKLIITVPSVDTSVCSLESKKFSEAAKGLGDSVAVYIVSADLPFALNRWCAAEGVDNLTMASDYRTMEMARSWGLYIKELGLFARAVYVLDENGVVIYREVVSEIANEPDYDAALSAVR